MLPVCCSLKLFINQDGTTALSQACARGHSDIAKFLIEAGAMVDAVDIVCCTCMCIHMVEINFEFFFINVLF